MFEREKFYNYVLENFTLSRAAASMLGNILLFIEENYPNDCDQQYKVLSELLDFTIGLDKEDYKKAFADGTFDKSNVLLRKFEKASEDQVDELDFFMELLGQGHTLNDIKVYLPEKYNYSKGFMEEHGLI